MKPTVYGVGINDADYQLKLYEYVSGKQTLISECPYYVKWKDVLRRCYSETFQEKNPTYKGCTVSDDWKIFSNFKQWMEAQDWMGKALDKDLLYANNTVYSSSTCIFITPHLNGFLSSTPGEHFLGTRFKKDRNKFDARIMDFKTNKRLHLGHFESSYAAHRVWQLAKISQIHDIVVTITDVRITSSLMRIANTIQDEYDRGVVTTHLQ